MQSMNLNGMQVIVLSQPGLQNEQQTPSSMRPRLVKQLIGLGVVHILNGVFCIIFQGISKEKASNSKGFLPLESLAFIGHGFWTGFPFLVTGMIGVSAGICKGNCQIVAFIILSIFSAILASMLISIAVMSVIFVNPNRYFSPRGSPTFYPLYDEATILVAMSSVLAAVGILEGIIAIWSSIVCCLVGVCNCCLPYPQQTQPLIISAEQQAALMLNQQQSTVGFYPQQQTVQYNRPQANAPPYGHNDFLTAATVEGAYTCLNTEMNIYLSPSDMDASAGTTTSFYEELQ